MVAPGTVDDDAAAAALRLGIEAHKRGKVASAEEQYLTALAALRVDFSAGAEAPRTPVPSEVAAEALHLLGALRAQRAVPPGRRAGGENSDSEGEGSGERGSNAALLEAIALLRGALAAQHPGGGEAPARARRLCSLGIALLRSDNAECWREAAKHLRGAVRLHAELWSAWANRARALRRLVDEAAKRCEDREVEALRAELIETLQEMAQLRPSHPNVMYRLGMALMAAGRHKDAEAALERHLAQAVEHRTAPSSAWKTASAQHWLAVLRGENSAAAPAEYVASLFDSYADHFEEHLVEKLHYQTPVLLAQELRKAILAAGTPPLHRCADLGCGTGLMAPHLRALGVEKLEGVDLSAKMLKKAEDKGGPGVGYDRLVCGDLLEVFTPGGGPAKDSFALICAADVFVYLGDLAPTFETAARWLSPGGFLAFSTEAPPPLPHSDSAAAGSHGAEGFRLMDTGRYVHSPSYVSRLGEQHELRLVVRKTVVLRMNKGLPVRGHVHVLAKSSRT